MSNSPIGFFDSGVGGLSVYARFRELLPQENTIYFGDLKNLPYGNKTPEQLIGFARNILDFFQQKNVKAVVIACNTSSALAYERIKNDYDFKIYPIIQSCAKVIASMEGLSKIGVFATEGTTKSKAYSSEIKKHNPKIQVKEMACPNWVSIVENIPLNINVEDDIRFHAEQMMEFKPDKIILGCTHYPYLIEYLKKYISVDLLLDPSKIFVEYIRKDLENALNTSDSLGEEIMYVSAQPELFVTNSKLFYNVENLPMIYNINKS